MTLTKEPAHRFNGHTRCGPSSNVCLELFFRWCCHVYEGWTPRKKKRVLPFSRPMHSLQPKGHKRDNFYQLVGFPSNMRDRRERFNQINPAVGGQSSHKSSTEVATAQVLLTPHNINRSLICGKRTQRR